MGILSFFLKQSKHPVFSCFHLVLFVTKGLMGMYFINFSLTWELGKSLPCDIRLCCQGGAWEILHIPLFLSSPLHTSLRHFSSLSLLPPFPSYSLYYHKSAQLRKTNGLFGVLNLILDPRRAFIYLFIYLEQINSNAQPIISVVITQADVRGCIRFPGERDVGLPPYSRAYREQSSFLTIQTDYILKSHSDSHWDLSGWGSAGVWNILQHHYSLWLWISILCTRL